MGTPAKTMTVRPVLISYRRDAVRQADTLPVPASRVQRAQVREEASDLLLVEDNEDDAELTLRAFRRASVMSRVLHARDGVEALEIIQRRIYAGSPLPSVVLLDMHLPRMSGWEVFTRLRSEASTQRLPVILLTGCSSDQARFPVADFASVAFLRKPVEAGAFRERLAALNTGVTFGRP